MPTVYQITITAVLLPIFAICYVQFYFIKYNLNSRNPQTMYHLSQTCGCAFKIDSQLNIVFDFDDKAHFNAVGSSAVDFNVVLEKCLNRKFNGKFAEILNKYTKTPSLYIEVLKKDTERIQESTRNLKTTVEEWQSNFDTAFDPRKTNLAGHKYGRTKPPFDSTRRFILAEGIEKKYRWENR